MYMTIGYRISVIPEAMTKNYGFGSDRMQSSLLTRKLRYQSHNQKSVHLIFRYAAKLSY